MLATGVDPATAKVAVELQLADLDDLLDSLYDEDGMPEGDERTSFEILRRDLQQELQTLEGQILTLQILKEEYDNRIAFSKLLAQEKQAASDHQLDRRLAGMAVSDTEVERCTEYEASICEDSECGDEQWEMAKELYQSALEEDSMNRQPLHGLRTIKAGVKAATKSSLIGVRIKIKCCACMEEVPFRDTLTLQCKPEAHTYCRACLVDLFTSSISNTTLFPPRCCKLPIPLDTCRAVLPKALIKDFDMKVEELATPNPTYCANAECSKFIRPSHIKADIGTCAFCKVKTCVRCKMSEHDRLCPSDPHVQLLMDMAKRSKWQQCTKCKNMVELEVGCFHMRCRCTHQFCYLCGASWVPRACECPQWDEEYLTPRARDEPDAEEGSEDGSDTDRDTDADGDTDLEFVYDDAPPPVVPHEHNWQHINGANCEACRSRFLRFAMRCRGCGISNCWRCIRNL